MPNLYDKATRVKGTVEYQRRFQGDGVYYIESVQVRTINLVRSILYLEERLDGDDMRDLAHKLSAALEQFSVAFALHSVIWACKLASPRSANPTVICSRYADSSGRTAGHLPPNRRGLDAKPSRTHGRPDP